MNSRNAERIAERRRAVTMLGKLQHGYAKRYAYAAMDAMMRAKLDVWYALREEAAYIIEEGVRMSCAHEAYPAAARAA